MNLLYIVETVVVVLPRMLFLYIIHNAQWVMGWGLHQMVEYWSYYSVHAISQMQAGLLVTGLLYDSYLRHEIYNG